MRVLRSMVVVVMVPALLAGMSAKVMAQEDAATVQPPVDFNGRLACTDDVDFGRLRPVFLGQFDKGLLVRRETRGSVMRPSVEEISDSRLGGRWTITANTDEYIKVLMATDPYPALSTISVRIENDEGAWQGAGVEPYLPGLPPPAWGTVVLAGEGTYDGLIAVLANHFVDEPCGWDVRGFVVTGEVPPMPEPTAN